MNVDAFLRKRKCKKIWRRIAAFLCVLLFIIILLSVLTFASISPNIVDYSREQLRSFMMTAINDGLFSIAGIMKEYSDFVTVVKDGGGQIIMLQANALNINVIARLTEQAVALRLNRLSEQGIKIPLGNLTNIPFFSGKGPIISIKVLPNPTVRCLFKSEFTDAGINQTLHKIYIEVNVSLALLMPTYKTAIENTLQVLVAENLIIGEVPYFYFVNGQK